MYVSASTELSTSTHCTCTQLIFVNALPKGIVALDKALDQDFKKQSSKFCSNMGLHYDNKNSLRLSVFK